MTSRLSRGYSRTAPLYDALAGPLYLAGLRKLLPHLRVPPFPAILDVGCGTGLNLLEAARVFAPTRLLCGIDISPGMIRVATDKAAQMGIPAQFIVGDAQQLPYTNGLFDLVICNSALHWFKDRDAAVREMSRVLRPGGQLALICASAPGFWEWFGLVDMMMQGAFGPSAPVSTPALPTGVEVAALLQRNGFRAQHLANPISHQRVFVPDTFVRLMSVVAPQWAADLTPEAQAMLERTAANLIRQKGPGGFRVTWAAVEAAATKIL